MPTSVVAKVQYGFRRDIATEDEVNALVSFSNGATGSFITCTHDLDGTDRLEILCDKGKIVVEDSSRVRITRLKDDEQSLSANLSAEDAGKLFSGQFDPAEFMAIERREYQSIWGVEHCEVLRNFAAAVQGEEELMAPGGDGIHGVRLANAIHLSSWLDREVSIEDFDEDTYLAELNKRIQAEGTYPTRS